MDWNKEEGYEVKRQHKKDEKKKMMRIKRNNKDKGKIIRSRRRERGRINKTGEVLIYS